MALRQIRCDGFSLLEMLLALGIGFVLVAVIGEALLGELGHSGGFARLLRERTLSERALELMRMELQEAPSVRVLPGPMTRAGCGLAGRTVLLHLDFTPDGVLPDRDVTYSLERNPDSIWRGQVLMRCGPAYGLDGDMSQASVMSGVWLDALDGHGMTLERPSSQLLQLRLKQFFGGSVRQSLSLSAWLIIAVPELRP